MLRIALVRLKNSLERAVGTGLRFFKTMAPLAGLPLGMRIGKAIRQITIPLTGQHEA